MTNLLIPTNTNMTNRRILVIIPGKGMTLFDVLTGDQELEVRMATYGPEIDQSQRAKSVSHIINICIKITTIYLFDLKMLLAVLENVLYLNLITYCNMLNVGVALFQTLVFFRQI